MDCITIRWNEFVLLMIIRCKNEFMLRLLLFVNNTHAKFATDNPITTVVVEEGQVYTIISVSAAVFPPAKTSFLNVLAI